MDVTSLATAFIAAKAAEVQFAVAARMLRMNAQMEASVAQLVEAGQQNAERLANLASGVGGNLDIIV